ncbi:hypothetical protein RIF29_28756 [Crotalaria pallida]|uniref:Uncharacterized protein n=1 Tax=Crotalaria pallida TaxID=3830 RepID=A0AAN9EJY2_CROPI
MVETAWLVVENRDGGARDGDCGLHDVAQHSSEFSFSLIYCRLLPTVEMEVSSTTVTLTMAAQSSMRTPVSLLHQSFFHVRCGSTHATMLQISDVQWSAPKLPTPSDVPAIQMLMSVFLAFKLGQTRHRNISIEIFIKQYIGGLDVPVNNLMA